MTIYPAMSDADKAAPVGHYIMFREKGRYGSEWCVMSPAQRDYSHARDAGLNAWRTWARKEATP